MRNVFLILGILVLAGQAQAVPTSFEIGYTNHAWGYDANGCFVDQNRFIYKYGYGHSASENPIENVGRVSEEEFSKAKELATKAAKGEYTEKPHAYDAGSTLWTGTTHYGQTVKLKALGDFAGRNDAPEATALVELMNKWCDHQPDPFFEG